MEFRVRLRVWWTMTILLQHTPVAAPVMVPAAQVQVAAIADAARLSCVSWAKCLHPSQQHGFIWSGFTPSSAAAAPSVAAWSQQPAIPARRAALVPQMMVAWSNYTPVAVAPVAASSWMQPLSMPVRPLQAGQRDFFAWSGYTPPPVVQTPIAFIGMPSYPDWIGGPL